MPRKFRQELLDTGVVTNYAGTEVARLTLNNLVIINQTEMYFSILQGANKAGAACPMTYLCTIYGAAGSYGYDINVDNALRELEELKVIRLEMDPVREGRIHKVVPLVTPTKASRIIPKYVTRAEILAGLQPIEEETNG